MIFTFFFIITCNFSFSFNSCEDKLQRKVWPLDCFLAANIQNLDENSKFNRLLDQWCTLFGDKLLLTNPPEAIFTLKMPETCMKLALRSRRHHESIKLLEGNFLNSFL